MLLVARIVDARDHLGDAVLLLRDLADDDVVLVVAGDPEDEVGRPRDPGALEYVDLGRVALLHLVLQLTFELLEAVLALLDHGHLVTHADQRSRQVRADLPASRDQDVHQLATGARFTSQERTASVSTEIAVDVGDTVRSPRVA